MSVEIALRLDLPVTTPCRCGSSMGLDSVDAMDDESYHVSWACMECDRVRHSQVSTEGTVMDTEWERAS